MHLKPISRELRRELYGRRRKGYKHYVTLSPVTPTEPVWLFTVPHTLPSLPQPPQIPIERKAIPLQGQRPRGRGRPRPRETAFQRQRAFRTLLSHKPWLLSPWIHPHLFLSLYPARSVLVISARYPVFKLWQHRGTCFFCLFFCSWFLKLTFTSLNLKFLLKRWTLGCYLSPSINLRSTNDQSSDVSIWLHNSDKKLPFSLYVNMLNLQSFTCLASATSNDYI